VTEYLQQLLEREREPLLSVMKWARASVTSTKKLSA
jgi:hypothetical protein